MSLLVLASWIAACGDRAPTGAMPFGVDGEIVVAPLTVFGAALDGRGTRLNLVLRHDGAAYELIDTPASDPTPPLARPVFSSASTVWAFGRVLLRSDDAGITWRVAAELPPLQEASFVALLVEGSASEHAVATIAMAADRAFVDGSLLAPLVFRRDVGASPEQEWSAVTGIASTRFPTLTVLRTRSGRAEILRQLGASVRGEEPPDRAVVVDAIDGSSVTRILRLDEGFVASDFATHGQNGWIAGHRRGADGSDASARAAIVRYDDELGPRETQILPAPSRATSADFADDRRGFICGHDASELPFCLATSDGGTSWTRGSLPTEIARVRQVLRGRRSFGWALGERSDATDVLLVTDDDGAVWSIVSLPPLGESVSIGELARNSGVSDWVPLPVATAVPRPTPTPPPAPSQVGAPRVWIAGDSTSVAPGIAGVVLRSDDLGVTWQAFRTQPGATFTSVEFVSAHVGWALARGHVLRTDDGGETFRDQIDALSFLGDDLGPRSLSAIDAQRAVMSVEVGRDQVLVFTEDGGATWQRAAVDDPPSPPLVQYRMCLTRGGRGLAWRGDERIALSGDGGASWRSGPRFEWRRVGDGHSARGAGFNDARVACSGTRDLWILVAGADAREETLWHSPDGGATWENLTAAVGAIPAYLPVVGTFVALSPCAGWLAIEQEEPAFPFVRRVALVRSRDCGGSWDSLGSPFAPGDRESIPEGPIAMRFSDGRTGVMVTSGATFATSDGGEAWLRWPLPDGFHPRALAIAPPEG